jgi:hypothetical protein
MKPERRCADIPIRGKGRQGYGRNECRDPEHARRVSESHGQRLGIADSAGQLPHYRETVDWRRAAPSMNSLVRDADFLGLSAYQ